MRDALSYEGCAGALQSGGFSGARSILRQMRAVTALLHRNARPSADWKFRLAAAHRTATLRHIPMDALVEALTWTRDNPRIAVGAAIALMALWGLAQRKPRVFRDAERDFARLRDERGSSYDRTRPLS